MEKKGISRRDVLKTASMTPVAVLLASYLKGGQDLQTRKRLNHELIVKALTDPDFRRLLEQNPALALKRTPTKANLVEINKLLGSVRDLEGKINAMADELLCACSVSAR